jgi:hypothetical protein
MRVLFIAAAFCAGNLCAQGTAPSAGSSADVKGLAVRANAAEYQTAVKTGNYTLAVDFDAHGVPTSDGVFSDEEYIVFEVAMFGPAGSHLNLQAQDFTLRINGAKAVKTAQPAELVLHSLKSPEWEASLAPVKKESSNGINAGGGGGQDSLPPPPPKMPIEVERKMELRVKRAALPEGDKALPVTGLLFFQYSGKTKNIRSMDLIYAGAAGKVTIPMQP